MSLRQKYLSVLSGILPAGAVGVSVLLGSTAPTAAAEHPAALQPKAAGSTVSERLAAIRGAVSDAVAAENDPQSTLAARMKLAWGNWWNNFGWPYSNPYYYRPWSNWSNYYPWNNWNNWSNWRHRWHNHHDHRR